MAELPLILPLARASPASFLDPQLADRIKLMSQDPLVDASVRRKLMRLLASWQNQYSSEPTMRHVAGLYAACGGGRKSDAQAKSEAAEAYRKRKEEEERERQVRSDRKAAERLQKEEDAKRAKNKGAPRQKFDFQKVSRTCVLKRRRLILFAPGKADDPLEPGHEPAGRDVARECAAAREPREGVGGGQRARAALPGPGQDGAQEDCALR